jgi:Histidine kinase-, DNA gyrase B-, and HSP90-like ATPase
VIGKDVLELVSSAMYVDPMTVYREYIQNAADAIDEARRTGVLSADEPGRVDIEVDFATRNVRIRDNGSGIVWPNFVKRLSALGASGKRGTSARGFRGVGRLAGLGYAQELIFRSRASGEGLVSELRWDSRQLKAAFRSTGADGGVVDLIRGVVTASRAGAADYPEHFFEVELKGVIRLRSDKLMTPCAIAEYLGQVAPVPFSPEFRFGADITAALRAALNLGELEIRISGVKEPVFRPHGNAFAIDAKRLAAFESLEIVEIPGIDGGIAGIAWILHHDYEGAVPTSALIKGLRLRSGNIQIGDHILLEELFPEPRFNRPLA